MTVERIEEIKKELRDMFRISTSELMTMIEIPEGCVISDKLLDEMITSEDVWLRRIVAIAGRPKDLSILVVDPSELVRYEVLFHKRNEDLRILKDDANEDIRNAAQSLLKSDCITQGILGRH